MKTSLLIFLAFFIITSHAKSQWYQQNSVVSRDLYSISFTDKNTGTAVGVQQNIIRTTDGGTTWTTQLYEMPYNLISVYSTDQNNGTAIGSGGLIFHTTNGEVTSVNDNKSLVEEFSIKQNYPNLFNPVTKIRYSIPTPPASSPLIKGRNEVGFVTLKVYDILGNEVATLVNEYKPAGIYEVEFNGHSDGGQNLSSGVYFYQLRAGNYIETKKMLLIR
ncbi:MAG TPA: YCF48-related protein [Ignavibacteriaceae bacterium]|nr:MAG: Ycf48-like protein [Ignavibacteria bacterium ADurb.Bin266]HQI41845.1 YCF48-related protein [Ignavibacteriaceae bacterium]